jgi:hypothetical protein
MIIPCGNSGTRPDENVHWDHGLLIDYDYSFLYARTVKEIALRLAKEGRDDLAALVEIITEKDPQGMDIDNEVLLHRTVSIIYKISEGRVINNKTAGNTPIHVYPTFDRRACKNRAFRKA